MSKRLGLLAAGGLAVALVAGGGTALAAAAGPVSGSEVITGCYTTAEVNGSHAVVLQDGGTTCPKGTSAVTWNEQGPAGPAGATGLRGTAGPAGATGPAGPAGVAGTNGTNGNTILSGSGAPGSALGNNGDFYLDTAADVLYGPKAGGVWPAGVSLTGGTGPQGPAGPQGPPGPAGSAAGTACTTDGGAVGTVTEAVDSTNTITWTCVANTTDASCTHSDGIGQAYTDCNDALGVPGNAATYNQTMASDAAAAYVATLPAQTFTVEPEQCPSATGDIGILESSLINDVSNAYFWVFSGQDAGTVMQFSGGAAACEDAEAISSANWN